MTSPSLLIEPERPPSPSDPGVRSGGGSPSQGPARAGLLLPCLLLALSAQPGDSRTVGEELRELGLVLDVRAIGRRLRALERSGLVRRRPIRGELAGDRRWYELTESGRGQLDACAELIGSSTRRVEAFLAHYVASEVAASSRPSSHPWRLSATTSTR
jgi:DNA-binding HxlR family transcriptional regulator